MQNRKSSPITGQDMFDLLDLFGTETETESLTRQIQTSLELEVQSGWIYVEISNKTTPRPRARVMQLPGKRPSPQIYNPSDYMEWKKSLAECIASAGIKPDRYNSIDIIIGIPLRKSYKKKDKERLLDSLNDTKPDFDNFTKGILDAITNSGVIKDDNVFGSGLVEKVWISEDEKPFVMFNLRLTNHPRINHRALMLSAKKFVANEKVKNC